MQLSEHKYGTPQRSELALDLFNDTRYERFMEAMVRYVDGGLFDLGINLAESDITQNYRAFSDMLDNVEINYPGRLRQCARWRYALVAARYNYLEQYWNQWPMELTREPSEKEI